MCFHCTNRCYHKGEAFVNEVPEFNIPATAGLLVKYDHDANASPLPGLIGIFGILQPIGGVVDDILPNGI